MQRDSARAGPVSCESCRSRKLKCNRVQPCSNCVARRVSCTFLVPPADETSTLRGNSELLRRIEQLESTLLKQQTDFANSDITRQQPRHPSSESITVSDPQQEGDNDSRWLENIRTREDSFPHRSLNGLTFRIRTVQEILETQNNDRLNSTVVTFPIYGIATLLLQSYESNVDVLCHILHFPTLKSILRNLYLRVYQSEPISPSQAALLLSVFAAAAYYFQIDSNSEFATSQQDALRLSHIFSREALDVLDFSRRNSLSTLEEAQASLIMSFVTYHLHGSSAGCRFLLAAATSIATDLRLQRIDADDKTSASGNEESIHSSINLEVKRRVFWHIATTDWLLSTISGPQEGMYFIHPHHVHVRLPINYADEDPLGGQDSEPLAGPHPTGVTFCLERLRLAHLCREITDTVPLEISNLLKMPYDQVIALDEKLQYYISSLPFFYKLDTESRRRSRPIEVIYPRTPVLRYFIITEAHNRRCKLHQRFLHRQSINPRYEYSRQACLESARAIVQSYKELREQDSSVRELMGMAVHFTHTALVIMVMDLCFNRGEADEENIKADVKAALEMFGDRSVSPLLGRFLKSLSDILQKHQVDLHPPTSSIDRVAGSAHDTMPHILDNSTMQYIWPGQDAQDLGTPVDTSFDDLWQSFMQNDANPDLLTWDNLLSDLDSRQFQ